MKLFHVIVCSIGLISTGCDKSNYEFHSAGDGQLIWRCNRLTGEITAVRTNLIFAPTSLPSPIAAYELHNSTDTTPLLINKLTGQTWRFFRNYDAKGSLTLEGFILLDKYGGAVDSEPTFDSTKPYTVETNLSKFFGLENAIPSAEQFLNSTNTTAPWRKYVH